MNALRSSLFSYTFRRMMLLAAFLVPQLALGQWQSKAGAQFPDCLAGGDADAKLAAGCQARQVMAFVPNEIWIHQNDSITWTHASDEGHTVTFLNQPQPANLGDAYPAAQTRVSGGVGCSAFAPNTATSLDNSAYDPSGGSGLQCVNSGTLGTYGTTYTVSFPAKGNFKFTCLIHASMNGTVHVLDPSATLPYSQQAYNNQATGQIVNTTWDVVPLGLFVNGGNPRVYTVGKVVATGGGWQYGSMFRFVDAQGNVITKASPLQVHLGQTVEFANIDPAEPHTITFGCPTDDPACPVGQVAGTSGARAFVNVNDNGPQPLGTAGDGARYVVMNGPFHPADEGDRSAGDKSAINAGLLIPQAQDRTGLAQVSPSLNRFRVTFNTLGQYRFICELHDEIGMIGWVNVIP